MSYPDTEGACRTWLRSLPAITALVGQRTFFAVPDDADETDFPLVTVARVGGGGPLGEAPVDQCLLQLTVFGTRRGKAAAFLVANALRKELDDIRQPVAWDASVNCLGASLESMIYTADPTDQRPQYSLTVEVVTVSSV